MLILVATLSFLLGWRIADQRREKEVNWLRERLAESGDTLEKTINQNKK